MLAEDELLLYADYVLFVLRVVVAQLLQNLGLDQTLLVQPLLVSEDLECNVLLVLVIKTFENLAEAALTEPVDDLEAVADVLTLLRDVLVLVVVEAVVVDSVGRRRRSLGRLALVDVEPINGVVVKDLLLFDLHQVLRKIDNGCPRVHREFQLPLLISKVAIACLLHNRRETGGHSLFHSR